jgi:hypothetical protein
VHYHLRGGTAPGTVNARLAALRGLARKAYDLRVIEYDQYHAIQELRNCPTEPAPTGRPAKGGELAAPFSTCSRELYLLPYIDDEAYRRRVLTQLNRGESRHSLARATFYGQRGELRQRYREGQEDQLGALGLVVNALVLWNSRYIGAVLDRLRADGEEIPEELVARLSPLGHEHINMLGRYTFALAEPLARGALRPLRDPAQWEETLA